MKRTEALAEARKRWQDKAVIKTWLGYKVGWIYYSNGKRMVCWEGFSPVSWELAFESADVRMAEQAKRSSEIIKRLTGA